jgi:uncharacterized repeat protein (TIGR03803 family)
MTRKLTRNYSLSVRAKSLLNIFDVGPRFGATKLAAGAPHIRALCECVGVCALRGALTLAVVCTLLLIAARPAQAQTETVLYNFTGGSDGSRPQSSLIADGAGNLYGTTALGGTCPGWNQYGCGVVFEISPNGSGGWKQTVLHTFAAPPDGAKPLFSPVIFDKSGNLYGTTQWGGASNVGTVFELSPAGASWTATILYSFTGGADGGHPAAGLVMDPAGNLYGTGQTGGANGQGTVFKLSPSGAETLLYTFGSQSGDGSYPFAGLVLDETGNLYGTTLSGGANGGGTVFKLAPTGTETVLYSFGSRSGDGSNPDGGFLIFDNNGNLYGTTLSGGANGGGTVFKLAPTGTETVLYSFGSRSGDASNPWSGLVFDEKGNLYGTTHAGGAHGAGAVFEVNPSAVTTTTLTSSLNPSVYGQAVTFTAVVSAALGTPTGTVIFFAGSTALGSATLANGSASLSTSSLSAGSHSITAAYQGSGAFEPSTSSPLKQVVNVSTTKTAVTTSGSPSFVGQPVTFSATVTDIYGAIPDGELVTFYDDGTAIGTGTTAGGVATFTTSSLTAKTHTVKATYAGDGVFKPSSGTVMQVVDKYPTTTALSSSLNPSNYGQTVTFTATVTPTGPYPLTGKVVFKDGTIWIGAATLSSGVATHTKSNLAVGTHSITATYDGDAFNGKSVSAAITQTVSQASLSMVLTSTPNPSTLGKSVKFTATLTSNGGVPAGQPVTFSYNGVTLGTANVNKGVATFSTTTLPRGSDPVTAAYAGSVDYSSASASVTQVVN